MILQEAAPFDKAAGEEAILEIVVDGVESEPRVRLLEGLETGAVKVLVG